MAKTKTEFYCQNCGARATKWLGRCPSCNEWNTYAEEIISQEPARQFAGISAAASVPRKINEIDAVNTSRIPSGQKELDRVLGGGIVPGSLVLIGGEPGIGKSTLMLQMALQLKGNRKSSMFQAKRVRSRSGSVPIACIREGRTVSWFLKQPQQKFSTISTASIRM
jgi:DNA repair protein RadA/Sms